MPARPRLGMFGNLGMSSFPQAQELYSSYLSSLDRPSPTDQSLLGLGSLAPDPDDLGHREIVAWRNLTGDAYARTAVDRYGTVLHRHLHGKREPGGWQVDHYPIAKCEGGPDIEWNWQALGYKANELEGAAMSALLRRGLLW